MNWVEQVENSHWTMHDDTGRDQGICIKKCMGIIKGRQFEVFAVYADTEYLCKSQSLDAAKMSGVGHYTALLAGWVC